MEISEYIDRAQNAIREGEFEMAERYLSQVLRRNPENEEALKGLRDLEVAKAGKSWSIITRGVKMGTTFLAVKSGKPEKAVNDLEILYRLNSNNHFLTMLYAECLQKLNRLEEAHETYKKVLQQNATDEKALTADAEILIQLDRLDEAVKRLERLQALRPKDDTITHRIRDLSARSYARVGIPENLKERRAKIEKEKMEAPAPPEFMETLEKMLHEYQHNPENRELGVQIAAHYREGKLYAQASRILGPILDKDHNYQPAKREQARVWRHTGDVGLATRLFDELITESPEDLHLKDEYLDARIAQLQKEPSGDGHARQEIEVLQRQREENRIMILRRHLEDHPEDQAERAELAELLLKHGQVEEAITTSQKLIQTRAFAGRGFFLLGQSFRAKGDNHLAVAQYEKALEFFKNKGYSHVPSDELKAVYYNLGVAREELGDLERAREAYGYVYSVDINYQDIRKKYENSYLKQ